MKANKNSVLPSKQALESIAPITTAQQLGSLIKSARDIMRKDKGLNGDLDRLPMLTWVLFLKFLDDMEQIREQESKLAGERFRPAIKIPYRWRDWGADDGGITGPELIAFINQDEAVLPNGKKGPGLFAYLRGLQSPEGAGREEVIANVFRGVVNRMSEDRQTRIISLPQIALLSTRTSKSTRQRRHNRVIHTATYSR